MESSKRSKQHRESSSSKRDKKASSSNRDSHSGGKKQQAPRFGNLIPRNDELKHLATNILGDYHSTVETLTQDHNRLMGVDRTLPITPLPSSLSSSSNPFENAFRSHVNRQTKAPPTSLTINSHFSNEEPLPHPLSQADGSGSRHSKKRKKNQSYKKEPEPAATEHAQFESLPKSAIKGEEKKLRKLKKEKYESFDHASSDHATFPSHVTSSSVVSSGGHVSSGSLEAPPPPPQLRKPNKLFIDTSSLDASDLQSIKDLIHLPPFITPIHTPCKKLDNPFHFPSSQSSTASLPNATSSTSTLATTTIIMDSQNAPNTLHGNPITRTSSHQSGPGSIVPDILGDISSSEDNTSSSSEDEDEEESEGERETAAPGAFSENTSSMLDQIRRELNPSLNTITPLKSSPPTLHRSLLLPATDESANLSPAKFPHPFPPPPSSTAPSTANDHASSDSDSCSDSDSDSDSESESESQPLQSEAAHNSVLSGEGNTQPFDPAQHSSFDHTHTRRQESRPFTYEPESATPTPTGTQYALGNFSQSHSSHTHQQSHGERGSSHPKKRRHSENARKRRQNASHQERDDKKIHLSEVQDFSNSRVGSDDPTAYRHSKPHLSEGRGKDVSELVVQISLAKVEVPQKTKPQATVGPYHISDSKRTGSVSDSSHSYRDTYHHSDHRGWSNDYSRSHREGGGERHWNETPPPGNRPNDEHWYHESNSTNERNRHVNPQLYYERARSLKREADSLPPNDAVRKALKYMEAVTYFMRHGYSQETDLSVSGSSSRGGAYKIYSDIVNMVKYCSKMGSECKPLLILCLRCHSVLLWRMYTLRQYNVHQLYKELQDVFNTSSKHHQKSPVPSGNFSPLPSPTSVGSTASSCSVPSASEQSLTINKSSCSKVMEYLTLTNHVHQSVELWRQSDSMSSQHKDFFSNITRKMGDITQFSSLTIFTEWMENGLQHISRNV